MATSIAFATGVNLARKSPDLACLLIIDARHKITQMYERHYMAAKELVKYFGCTFVALQQKDFHSKRYLIPVSL